MSRRGLREQAEAVFGAKGLIDVINLVGLHLATSALLNVFCVPAPKCGCETARVPTPIGVATSCRLHCPRVVDAGEIHSGKLA